MIETKLIRTHPDTTVQTTATEQDCEDWAREDWEEMLIMRTLTEFTHETDDVDVEEYVIRFRYNYNANDPSTNGFVVTVELIDYAT